MVSKVDKFLEKCYKILGMHIQFKLSSILLIIFLFTALKYPESEFILIILLLIIIAASAAVYFGYSHIILKGYSKKLFDCKNLNKIDKNKLKDYIEIAKYNLQILHSFLVMAIAFVALFISLYSLYNSLGKKIYIAWILAILFLIDGLMFSIIVINIKWYSTYSDLMDLKLK